MGITSHLRLSSLICSHPPNFALFASSAASHVVNASPSFSSAVFSHEVNMLAIAALLVLSVTAQAAKYDYGSYGPDYDSYGSSYESDRYGRDVYEHSMYKRSTDEGIENLTGFARTDAEEREGQQRVSGCARVCALGICAKVCGRT